MKEQNPVETRVGLGPWLILLRYTHFEELPFWFANFLQERLQEIQNLHWLSGHFSENPLSMCRILWHYLFWAIHCLSSHSCTIVSYYSLQLKILCFCIDLSCLFMVLLLIFYTDFIFLVQQHRWSTHWLLSTDNKNDVGRVGCEGAGKTWARLILLTWGPEEPVITCGQGPYACFE